MDPHFESVYVNDSQNRSEHKLLDMERLKIGEVFQVRQDHFAFVCIHCSQEFQSFHRFTAHIASHYHNAMHWMTPGAIGHDPMDVRADDPPPNDESVEWLYTDSDNDSVHNNSGNEPPHLGPSVECDVQLHEDYSHAPASAAYEPTENGTLPHESQCFKTKHPLMRVNESPDARRIQPYFTKRHPFERTPDQRLKCPFCEFAGATKATVREHLFGHVGAKMFACKICDAEFGVPRELHDHIEQAHNEVAILWPDRRPKRIAIEQLDSRGNVRESNVLVAPDIRVDPRLLMHSPTVKTEPKYDANGERIRSQCYICHKTFSRPNGFMKHLKVHTEEKNYQCITCGAQFRRSDHLSRHQLIHEAPKFKCDVCDMTFRRSDKLLEHRRKHAETMNFTCENCGLGFMELASIKTHVSFHCKGKADEPSASGIPAASSTITTTELAIGQPLHEPNALVLRPIILEERLRQLEHQQLDHPSPLDHPPSMDHASPMDHTLEHSNGGPAH